MTDKEKLLIEIMKANRKDVAISYLQWHIQIYGFLSNQAGREVRKIIGDKNKNGKRNN